MNPIEIYTLAILALLGVAMLVSMASEDTFLPEFLCLAVMGMVTLPVIALAVLKLIA